MTKTPINLDLSAYSITDPQEFAENMLQLMEESSKALSGMATSAENVPTPFSNAQEVQDAARTASDISQRWMMDPAKFMEAQSELVQSYAEVWNLTVQRMFGQEPEPVAELSDFSRLCGSFLYSQKNHKRFSKESV